MVGNGTFVEMHLNDVDDDDWMEIIWYWRARRKQCTYAESMLFQTN